MSQFDDLIALYSRSVFTAFDTETTGLDPRTNRVVEVGGIRMDARGISSRFNSLINPNCPMPAEVTKINGITDAMLTGKPDAKIVIPDFLRFAGDSVLIAHNAPFDISFVNEELNRLGAPLIKNRVIDTRIFAREVFPGLPNYKLQDLASRFGIVAKDAHRAEDDARVCLELFLVCMDELRKKNPRLVEAALSSDLFDNGKNMAGPHSAIPSTTAAGSIGKRDLEELFAEDAEDETFDENPV